MINIKLITRCTRSENLEEIYNSIIKNYNLNIRFNWTIVFDTNIIKRFDKLEFLNSIVNNNHNIDINIVYGKTVIENDYGHDLINKEIDKTENSYIYILDDDNILHENFIQELYPFLKIKAKGILFNQFVNYKDFTKSEFRIVDKNDINVGKIDSAQFLFHKDLVGNNYRLEKGTYVADGIFISNIFKENKDDIIILDKVLCYYNYLQKVNNFWLPKILYIGNDNPILESKSMYEKRLNVLYCNNIDEINKAIINFKPNCILTSSNTSEECINCLKTFDMSILSIWIHEDIDDNIGEKCYICAMNNILNYKYDSIVSYITPTYNTKEKLYKTYESLKNQTNKNWEWVIVDDSTDNGKTLSIIKELSSIDNRISYYDFSNKSGGIIGESKYRGFMMAKGEYLAEFDHDDYLLPECTEYIIKAFKSNNEVGFVYSDCIEMGPNYEKYKYPDGFAFGYGSYRTETINGIEMPVINQQGINPKTIRHIVGVPNHIRVWKKNIYYKIGGHNRKLTIADDYELIVRTFLETKMMFIPKLLYIQFIYNNNTGRNTHDLTRMDIQRRVDTISRNYNERIKNRFEELGVNDWAYEYNNYNPLLAPSLFGELENKINLIYEG